MQEFLSLKDTTLKKFLKPQLSTEQSQIKRTYLQAAAQNTWSTSKNSQTVQQIYKKNERDVFRGKKNQLKNQLQYSEP